MADEQTTPRPPIHLGRLIFGVTFIAIGVVGVAGTVNQAWVWVALLTAAGVAGLTATITAFRAEG